MPKTCEQVMTREVRTCSESDPISRAAQVMRDSNIGFLPVTNTKGTVTGVVTDRDIALRIIADGKPHDTPVNAVMSREELLKVKPGDTLQSAEELMMQKGRGRALVVDSFDKVVGVISGSNIAKSEPADRTGQVLAALTQHRRSTQ